MVAQDEKESGIRALLNLGHTFGHAIEANMGYGNWLHCEAVSAGTVMKAKTAQLQGLGDASQFERILAILKSALACANPREHDLCRFHAAHDAR